MGKSKLVTRDEAIIGLATAAAYFQEVAQLSREELTERLAKPSPTPTQCIRFLETSAEKAEVAAFEIHSYLGMV